MNEPHEFILTRYLCEGPEGEREGFTLGRLTLRERKLAFTVEDQDRRLEEGNGKLYGRTAIPLGRYKMTLYQSPKHGLVPLLHDVPGFTYIEMHKANDAEDLLGCVGVGDMRTMTGVRNCAPALTRIVAIMLDARSKGIDCYCTVQREDTPP